MNQTNDGTAHRRAGVAPPGFRLPAETRVGRVRLQVSDLGRSMAYYEQVIGLRVLDATAATATLGGQDDRRPLVSLVTRPGLSPARRGALGLYHFAILLPDRAALGRFAAHLGDRRERAGMADHLVSEALYLSDPDGLGIEVYADRPRESWRVASGEIAMTTDPLDIRSLMAAGGDRTWDGVPAGTVIGHVHLHVGDLREGEAFYHAALGLDKMVWSYPGALFLAAGGYHHHLGTNVWSSGPPARDAEARLIDWQLVVSDPAAVKAAADSLQAAGYAAEPVRGGYGVPDPWGTRVQIAAAADADAAGG